MNIKRPLAPGFLNKLDNWLLLHKPNIWSTRVHLVLYYSFLAALGILGISYISPLNFLNYSSIFFWTWLTALLSVIGIVVWMIYLLRFNVFKRYGSLGAGYSIKSFLCYFVATGCFVLLPFLPSYMETLRTKMHYNKSELIQDINTINTSIAQIEYKQMYHIWKTDTVKLVTSIRSTGNRQTNSTNNNVNRSNDQVAVTTQKVVDSIHINNQQQTTSVQDRTNAATPSEDTTFDIDESEGDNYIPRRRGYGVIDSAYLAKLKAGNDSITHLYDDIYVHYTPPPYQYINSYNLERNNKPAILNNREIYDKVIKNYKKQDVTKMQAELERLIKKYNNGGGIKQHHTAPHSFNAETDGIDLFQKYQLPSVERSITNIADKLGRYDADNWPIYFRIFIYITLGLSLLVYIFRHTEKRTFFLSLLSAILLFLFSSLLIAFNNLNEIYTVGLILFYIVVFFLLSLTIWASKVRSRIAGIGLNLFTYTVFGVPLLLVFYSFLIEKKRYRFNQNTAEVSAEYDYSNYNSYPDYHNAFIHAEWAGFVLLLILIATYIHRTYRKWYALPEN